MSFLKRIQLCAMVLFFGLGALSAIAEQATPEGLLKIECEFERPNGLPALKQSSLGFLVETDGFLLTTYKQITDPETNRLSGDIKVILKLDGQTLTLPAEVIGVEATLNFAILKVTYEHPLPALPLNKERTLVAEEPVFAYYVNAAGEFARIPGSFTEMNTLECYQANLTATMLKT